MSVSEIQSVWVCRHCKSMFPGGPEMAEYHKGKKWGELDCPKCKKQLWRWTTTENAVGELLAFKWLEDRGMVKTMRRKEDETPFCEKLVAWVEEHKEELEED